jgi:hypothetical protein
MNLTSSWRRVAATIWTLAVALATPAAAGAASDNFRLTEFSGKVTTADGARDTRAGAHPDVTNTIRLSSHILPSGSLVTDANVRDIDFELPAGLIGNPQVGPRCSMVELLGRFGAPRCSPDSQIGEVLLGFALFGADEFLTPTGLYNIVPPPGVTARFGFNALDSIVTLDATVDAAGGYHVTARSRLLSQGLAVISAVTTLWGVPADPVHDAQRLPLGTPLGGSHLPASSTVPPRAFITAPTRCSATSLTTRIAIRSWQHPEEVLRASFDHDADGLPFLLDGCDNLPFAARLKLAPTASVPDAPSGAEVTLTVPQNDDPEGLGASHLKDVTVSLPEGMTVNPASAAGLTACTDEQLGIGNNEAPACAESSKIGIATATTPLLEKPLGGSVYVLTQNSDRPESGEMFRLGLVVDDVARGVLVKLRGNLVVDEATGRITTVFKNNPEMPVESIKLSLKDGPRGPLATPGSCGQQTTTGQITSWSGRSVDVESPFEIGCTPSLGGFAPELRAGAAKPVGGAFSPFTATITKPDGNAAINGLTMTLPTGLLAQLRGNLNAQVGSVVAYAGPGSSPYQLPGKVFLEGRYGDAPFSLRVVVPAKAGPFDLGEVVVRQKLYVDPITAQVTVVSDPIPTIVAGVPARLQRLDVNIDKPGFTLNPTSCAPKSIGGVLGSVAGTSAALSVRFQVGDCASLDLKPGLALSLSGKGQTTDGKHPAITANLMQAPGQANLKKVRVALPLSLALDVDNANGLCEFVDGSKVTPTCPKASIVGTATATSPILDEPVSGPVYFVKNVRKNARTGRDVKTLPKLVIPLVGENGIKLTLTGTSDVEDNHLVTTFDNIPDAPVSSFKLNINGGKGGILAVSGADICKATQIADQQVDGQNNKQADADVFIQTPSCPVKLISKSVGKTAIKLKVGGLGVGKVTVSGKGIKKTTKAIAKSTVATITVKRTKARLGKVKVAFVPAGSKKAKAITATLR